jgi:hypothetical protein
MPGLDHVASAGLDDEHVHAVSLIRRAEIVVGRTCFIFAASGSRSGSRQTTDKRRGFMNFRRTARIRTAALVSVLVGVLAAVLLPAAGGAAPPSCDNRNNNTYAKLLDCVTVEGVRAHQAALQRIADANDDEFYPDSRAAGTEGYSASVDYVAGLLRDAGYEVTLDPFEFQFQGVILRQLTPTVANYPANPAIGTGFGTSQASRPARSRSSNEAPVGSTSRRRTHRQPAPAR